MEITEVQPTITPADIPIEANVLTLSQALKQGDPGIQVFVVGGAVRDYLFNKFHGKPGSSFKPKDLDITTNLSEEEILERLRSPFAVQKGIRVNEKTSVDTFGVVFANINDKNYEIAPFRKDIGSVGGRRPERVERGAIHDDAMRRDLTMNNLYYNFENKTVLDFNPGGQGVEDIKSLRVRPVGDPFERFGEDKLRILRLIRFASRFNPGNITDSLDQQTASAIRQYGNLREQGISSERIFGEFTSGIAQSMNTASFLNNLIQLGLMGQIFPGLHVDIQGAKRLTNSKNLKVILAWLLRNNRNIADTLRKLTYPNDVAEGAQFLVSTMQIGPETIATLLRSRDKHVLKGIAHEPGGERLSPEKIQELNQQMAATTRQDLAELARVSGDPALVSKLTHFGAYQPPVVSGEDLMKQGFKGPAIGQAQKRQLTTHYQQSFQDYLNRNPVEPQED